MLTKKIIKSIKDKLLIEKKILSIKPDKVEVDSDGDETDNVQANLLIEMQLQFAVLNNRKLVAIEEALQRIKDSTYGVCVDCQEDIAEKRLLVNPYFLTCISCAEEREMLEKQTK